MRHADKPTVEDELHIEATPERVWSFVTDLPLLVTFSQELQAVEWEDGSGGPPRTGRRFVGTSRNEHFGEWQTTSTVTECDEPRALAWSVGDLDEPNTSWRFTLRPDGAGTVLSQWAQLGTGPSGITIVIARMPDKEERIVQRRIEEFRTAIRTNLQGIKELAERPVA